MLFCQPRYIFELVFTWKRAGRETVRCGVTDTLPLGFDFLV